MQNQIQRYNEDKRYCCRCFHFPVMLVLSFLQQVKVMVDAKMNHTKVCIWGLIHYSSLQSDSFRWIQWFLFLQQDESTEIFRSGRKNFFFSTKFVGFCEFFLNRRCRFTFLFCALIFLLYGYVRNWFMNNWSR